MGDLDADAGRPGSSSGCRSSRRSRPRTSTAARRATCSTLVKKELLAQASPTRRSPAAACGSTTTFTQQRDGRGRAGGRATSGRKGLKELHVAVASVDPRPARCAGFYAGQDYLKSQINWAAARRLAGLGVQAVRARGRASTTATRSRAPSRATRRTSSPTATRSSTRDRGDGNDYGVGDQPDSPPPRSRSTPPSSTSPSRWTTARRRSWTRP